MYFQWSLHYDKNLDVDQTGLARSKRILKEFNLFVSENRAVVVIVIFIFVIAIM